MKFLQSIREEKRLWSFSVVLGILFSMFFTLGRVLQKHTSLEEFDASDGVGLFLSFVIWSCVFIAFLKCGSMFVDEYRCRKQAGVIWDKNKIFWIAFGVIVVAYIPVYLAAFPGVFSYDAPHQIWQFTTGHVHNNQPVISSYIILGIMSIGKIIFRSWEGGVAFYIGVQIIFGAATFAKLLQIVYSRIESKALFIIGLVLFAIHPMNHLFVVNCAKDVSYAYFTLWLVMLFGQAVSDRGKFFKNTENCIKLAAFLLLFLFYRNNSIYALIIFIPIALLFYKKARKRLAVILIGTAAVYMIVTGPVYSALGLQSSNKLNEMLAIPTQQIANTYAKCGDDFTDEEKEVVFKVFPEESMESYQNWYNPTNSDAIRPSLNSEALEEMGLMKFMKTWASIGVRHMVCYNEALLNNTRGYWYVFHEFTQIGSDKYIEWDNSNYGAGVHTKRMPVLKGLSKFYHSIGQEYSVGEVPELAILFAPATTFLLFIMWTAFVIYKKEYKYLVPSVLLWLLMGTLFVGPLALMRYIYPLTICMPFLFGILLEKSGEPVNK